MGGFGDLLRQAREARGATLATVAAATRIAPRHIEALERSDHGSLPAAPFAKGYIRAYAQHLGVDPEPILEAYRSEERQQGLDSPDAQNRVLEELSRIVAQRSESPRQRGRRFVTPRGIALGLAAALALVATAWLLSRALTPAPAVLAPVSQSRPAPSQQPALPSQQPPASASDTAPVDLDAPSEHAATPAPTARPPAPRPRRGIRRAALSVAEFGVGTTVRNHRLVGRADSFAEGSEVAFWTLVTGGEPGDVIRHVWFHEGQAVMRADLEVRSAHWRTFSRRVLPEGATGAWMVEARGPDGGILARQEFLCVPDES